MMLIKNLLFLVKIPTFLMKHVDMLSSGIDAESCLLRQTDSSTVSGGLKNRNFANKPNQIVQLTTAHQLANIIIQPESCFYSNWFPGEESTVSDLLSHDFHLSSTTLSILLEVSVLDHGNCFSTDFAAVQSAAKGCMIKGTNAKQTHAWAWYQLYLLSLGLQDDLFLENFNRGHKHKILSAFSQSIC